MHALPHARRPLAVVATGLAAALLVAGLAGCSARSADAAATSAPTSSTTRDGGGIRGGAQGAAGRGVSGLVAAASSGLLQVQGDGQQTAVHYTDQTTIQRISTVTASAITVGDCVTAITAQGAAAATTVSVSAASSDGTCDAGFGGADRQGMPRRNGAAPGDGGTGTGGPAAGNRPTPRPGMTPGAAFGAFTSGRVTAVSGDTLTVSATARPGATAGPVTVTLDAKTTVEKTGAGAAADLTVGSCVQAFGKADDKGGFEATALTSSAAVDGSCASGAGFPGRGGAGAPGVGPATGSGSSDD